MPIERVLITVKTYPTLSAKYEELVCTAGFREDGSWIRIYPIAFRKLPYATQYQKYDWLEIELTKNTSDFRPETYRPLRIEDIGTITDKITTDNYWELRKKYVLNNVYTSMDKLIAHAKDKSKCTSLAVFKPKQVLDFYYEPCERQWDKNKIQLLNQLNLFVEKNGQFKVVDKLPYKFKYRFIDDNNRESNLMIEDWEIGALYWNCLRRAEGNESIALEKVREKYLDYFTNSIDLHFFLGTTKIHHYVSINPFIIIGTFHPLIPKPVAPNPQLTLF